MAKLFRLSLWIVAKFSSSRAMQISGWVAVLLTFSKTAKVTRVNLETCFPELSANEISQRTRLSLQHMAYLLFELGQLRYWSVERLLGSIQIEGEQILEDAVKDSRGILLLVPHHGNWELMCAFLGHYYTVAALYGPPKIASLEAEILAARQRFAGKMFAIGVGGMRSVLKELKSGGLVAILPDQVPALNSGEYVPFFGQPALTMLLPQQLVQKTQCQVLVGFVERVLHEEVQYRLTFQVHESDASPVEINKSIEQLLLDTPEQYQWEYKRFKRPREPADSAKDDIYRRQ